jgi:hypothetical protein
LREPLSYQRRARNAIDVIAHNFIRQTIHEDLQSVFAQFTAEQLYSTKRDESRVEVQTFLTQRAGLRALTGVELSRFAVAHTPAHASEARGR